MFPYPLHRDHEYWPQAEEFCPKRYRYLRESLLGTKKIKCSSIMLPTGNSIYVIFISLSIYILRIKLNKISK